MMYHSEVHFEDYLPLIDVIAREVTLTTGMMVSCEAAGVDGGFWRFSNQKAGMEVDVMPYVEPITQECLYLVSSDSFNKWNPYLHQTLVFVLLKLGGKTKYQPAAWAGQPWLVAQKDWNPSYLKGLEAWYKR